MIYTFRDCIEHLVDYIGGNVDARSQRSVRAAIMAAHREVPEIQRWKYLQRHGRVSLVASYSTGTVAYDHTGGTYERQLTLSGGTWPTWAESGTLRISSIIHEVYERKSDTVLTLSETLNPGADLAAGTTYSIFRDSYVLPADFVEMNEILCEGLISGSSYVPPGQWLQRQRDGVGTGPPYCYTIMGDPNIQDRFALFIDTTVSTAATLDFIYQRKFRPMRFTGFDSGDTAGTITTSAGSATITGTGTSFTADMVGSILRGGTAVKVPSGRDGLDPYVFERTVTGWTSATSITVDSAVSSTYTGIKYVVSDPVDAPDGMLNLFLRCCEKQYGINKGHKLNEAASLFEAALLDARVADNRHFSGGTAGGGRTSYTNYKSWPLGAEL